MLKLLVMRPRKQEEEVNGEDSSLRSSVCPQDKGEREPVLLLAVELLRAESSRQPFANLPEISIKMLGSFLQRFFSGNV